ncbi:MAG: 23S rRNA (adenine(2503)-C(2))-methyltransferase RlmN [Campylobacterales bacterium]
MSELIHDFTKEELVARISPSFRARQIYDWLYKKLALSFEEMKNLPKQMRQQLEAEYRCEPMRIVNIQTSSDGTKKYLFSLHDGHTVEAVLLLMREAQVSKEGDIQREAQYTVCLSTQVGCKVGCAFCLTAKGGFVRNLTPGEIVGQVVLIKKDNQIGAHRRLNLVYMGMGEPLDNLDNVAKAIRIFSDPDGLAISPRRQTISTSGIATKIAKLGEMDLGVQLAISLHAVDDELRSRLIPMNKAYNIEAIIKTLKAFPLQQRRRILFEYLVLGGVNDDLVAAKKLVKLLHGLRAKVNLIYYNPHPGSDFKRPTEEAMRKFQEYLFAKGITCTIRSSRGLDISAACGQLREQMQTGGSSVY